MTSTTTLETQLSSPHSTPRRNTQIKYKTHWTRPPIVHQAQDPLSRFVVFDGSKSPYIELHFSECEKDPEYDALVEARWHEHLAEHYLKNTGVDLDRAGSRLLVNTPVQLYLAHSRLARAQLEIGIYSKLLEQEVGKSLRGDFDRTKKLCLPEDGLHVGPTHRASSSVVVS